MAIAAFLFFSTDEAIDLENTAQEVSTTGTPEVKSPDNPIQRIDVPQDNQSAPPPDLLKDFVRDLSLLFALENGRAFRYKQQRDKVDMLLAEGKSLPIEGIPQLLENAGSLVPAESLEQFLLLGLSEMKFVQRKYSEQANSLRFSVPPQGDGDDSSADRHKLAAIALQKKIRATPTAYPPEAIFFAFSEGLEFPTENKLFIQSLGRSRDKGILLASSSWMEYMAWMNTAQWQNSFPEYAEYPLTDKQVKSIPQVSEAYQFYLETEQLYLSSILGDMAAFGYLK